MTCFRVIWNNCSLWISLSHTMLFLGPNYKKSYDNLTIRFNLRYIVSQTYDKVMMLSITKTSYDNLTINLRYNLWQIYYQKLALLTVINKNKNIKIKQKYRIFTIYFLTLRKKTDQWWRDFPDDLFYLSYSSVSQRINAAFSSSLTTLNGRHIAIMPS